MRYNDGVEQLITSGNVAVKEGNSMKRREVMGAPIVSQGLTSDSCHLVILLLASSLLLP